MLLIQSDLFKALGFMLAPIYGLVFEPVKSSSTFCQVDGFIIALGVEASGTTSPLSSCPMLIYYRPRGPHDRYSQRVIRIPARHNRWNRRTLPVPACSICHLDRVPSAYGVARVFKSRQRLRNWRRFLFSTH